MIPVLEAALTPGLGQKNHPLSYSGALFSLLFPPLTLVFWLAYRAISGTPPALGTGEGGQLAALE